MLVQKRMIDLDSSSFLESNLSLKECLKFKPIHCQLQDLVSTLTIITCSQPLRMDLSVFGKFGTQNRSEIRKDSWLLFQKRFLLKERSFKSWFQTLKASKKWISSLKSINKWNVKPRFETKKLLLQRRKKILRDQKHFKRRRELSFNLTLKTWRRSTIKILKERRRNMKISLPMRSLSMKKRKIETSKEERSLNSQCKMKKMSLRSKWINFRDNTILL